MLPSRTPTDAFHLAVRFFPKISSIACKSLVQPKNTYYMVISPKLITAALVPLVKPSIWYFMVIIPKLVSAAPGAH